MEIVLRGLNFEVTLIYHRDNIIISAQDFDRHQVWLRQVLQCLCEVGLKLKPLNCQYACSMVDYLGYFIDKHDIISHT